jgi:hypothetical protein
MYTQPGRVSWRRKNSGSKIELFLTPRMGITLLKFKLFVGEILIDDLTWCIFIYESFDELLSICLLLGNLQLCIEKRWIFMRIHLSWGWILEWFFLFYFTHRIVWKKNPMTTLICLDFNWFIQYLKNKIILYCWILLKLLVYCSQIIHVYFLVF